MKHDHSILPQNDFRVDAGMVGGAIMVTECVAEYVRCICEYRGATWKSKALLPHYSPSERASATRVMINAGLIENIHSTSKRAPHRYRRIASKTSMRAWLRGRQ